MSKPDLVREMNAYYAENAPRHDGLMNYTDNVSYEKLLAPIVKYVEPFISGKDVLEIACGTGNWTQILSKRAKSVVATDVNNTVIELAGEKLYERNNVRFRICNAYRLQELPGRFTAAFAADWFSHIPISKIPSFLESLHARLTLGSTVVFLDMLRREHPNLTPTFTDKEGNEIRKRTLPSGAAFHVVKNYPSEDELRQHLKSLAVNIQYHEDSSLLRWVLSYELR